jgi:glycosyltransferase involved in cell wall biosynthesis
LRVKLYPSDATGCGVSRIVLPGEAARSEGCDVEIAHCPPRPPGQPPERLLPLDFHPTNPKLVRPVPIDADVLVFQRPVEECLVAVLPQLKAAGHAIVVEIDDDLERLHPHHPARQSLNPTLSPGANWRYLRQACQLADLVTVTTPALAARYGTHGRVAILPNCVPESILALPHKGDGRTVGWSGWTVTHPDDLRVTGAGIVQALDDTGARFVQVGPGEGVQRQLGLPHEPETTGGLHDIHDYYRALTRLDVGICPLADNQFNRGKSALKILEMSAAGAAVVASPTPEYQRVAAEGLCVLAGYRGREWRREVRRLLEDEQVRKQQSAHARELIALHHTYERNGDLWAEAWQDALDTARQRKPARAAA